MSDWRCPAWCTDTAQRHAEDSIDNDGGQGGATHRSRHWGATWPVWITQGTNGDRPDDRCEIWLGDEAFTVEQAKAVAGDLLAAVAVVKANA